MLVFKAHRKAVYAVVFSPDGQFLATSGGDATVRLWSLAPPTQVQEWPGYDVQCPLAYSPDGRFLACGGEGVRAWSINKPGDPLVSSDLFTESVAFSPDSKVLAAHAGGLEGLARWSLPAGKPLAGGWCELEENQFLSGGMTYHPDGSLLATCAAAPGKRAYDSMIYLWDAKKGTLRGSLHCTRVSYKEFLNSETVIRFSPNGTLLAGSFGPLLHVWDVKSQQELLTRQPGKKHFKGLAFTPDGRRLVTVSYEETVRLWDTRTWSEVGGFDWKIGRLTAVDVAPDGCRMAGGGSTGKVVIWDVDQ